jgi:hypothetical protein
MAKQKTDKPCSGKPSAGRIVEADLGRGLIVWFLSEVNYAALSFPDILTAGAGDRLRRMLLF